MNASFKKIGEYLDQENKTFVVPNYQRGYKWSVKINGNPSAVEKLMENLVSAFDSNKDYFIQGLTVCEDRDNIILIDGQQRTTTLYLILWCLNNHYISEINFNYDIRSESNTFINDLKKEEPREYIEKLRRNEKEKDIQDVYYFKEAILQISGMLPDNDCIEQFYDFIRNKVKLLYIPIDKEKAIRTFTMMNGSKATMLQEELVKAEMLRIISLPDNEQKEVSTSVDDNLAELKEIIAKDWEINTLRNRYAREWDKWLFWWNREDVKEFFGVKTPMGLLLDYYYKRKTNVESIFSFDNFRENIPNKKETKGCFKGLRDLQKSFEEIYESPLIYNSLGLVLEGSDINKYVAINYFIENKKDIDLLRSYAKWCLVGATHLDITTPKRNAINDINDNNNDDTKENRAMRALEELSKNNIYNDKDAYEIAIKQLLRLNVEEDNKLDNKKGRKFDFSIYRNRSLEHIHPKSKVYHKKQNIENTIIDLYEDGNGKDLGEVEPQESDWLNRDNLLMDNCTEHSIGNLSLLHKHENSKFKDSTFSEKKRIYFDVDQEFKSRNLLHTISVFSNSKWGEEEIKENQIKFIERFKKDYEIT